VIFNQLLDSDVPEDPYLSRELVRYFPKTLQERYSTEMEDHRLRREIIATAVTNSMVNRMGSTFVLRLMEDTGETPAQIAKAYSISREALDARELWSQIDGLDGHLPERAQVEALTAIWHLQRNMTRWLLNRPGANLNIAAMVERYQGPMAELREALPKVLPAESRADLQDDAAQWQARGFPAELAREFAVLPFLTYALDIIDIALDLDVPVADVGQAYFMLSDALHSKWLMDNVESLPVDGRWHAQARGVLRDELQSQQRALVTAVLAGATGGADEAVNAWLARDDASLRYTLQMFTDMRNLRHLDYPTLSVAVRRLAHVVACAYGNN
jgi:glutamate dehydrogenase